MRSAEVVALAQHASGRRYATREAFRSQVGAALRVHMDAMSDEQVAALEAATEALGSLVDTFLSATAT